MARQSSEDRIGIKKLYRYSYIDKLMFGWVLGQTKAGITGSITDSIKDFVIYIDGDLDFERLRRVYYEMMEQMRKDG